MMTKQQTENQAKHITDHLGAQAGNNRWPDAYYHANEETAARQTLHAHWNEPKKDQDGNRRMLNAKPYQ